MDITMGPGRWPGPCGPRDLGRYDRSLAVDSEIAYVVTYQCPRCKVELEAELGGWRGWQRCPACGTPSLPPDILLGHPATMRRVREMGGDDAAIVGIGADDQDGITTPDRPDLIATPPSPLVGALRLVFLTGMVMSLFILLIAYLDENQSATGIFGTLAIVFFLLLLRVPAARRKQP
jgi:hypothetical protein